MSRPATIDYEKVEAYIYANHERQTLKEMTDSLNEMGIRIGYNSLFKKVKSMDIPGIGATKASRVQEYVRINHEYETSQEMASFLNVSIELIRYYLAKNKLKALKPENAGNEKYFEKSLDKTSIEYWPEFEEMDERWHDALISIAAAAFGGRGREDNEGFNIWEERKARMKANRPKAEYDMIVRSDIVMEFMEECGCSVKR